MAIQPFSSLWGALGRHFSDPRLRQLFGRYATYCGASPFAAPATLMLVAHVEHMGVFRVAGGMAALGSAVAAAAAGLGVVFRYGRRVQRLDVEGGRVTGVVLADGDRLPAEVVVHNGDAGALGAGLLGPGGRAGPRPLPRRARSLSAVTWSWRRG